MNTIVHSITTADIEAEAAKSFGAEAQVIRYTDRELYGSERVEWFALAVRRGERWEVVGRRRSRIELLVLAKRGPVDFRV